MFETSTSLFFQSLLYNILLPIIPWILFLWLFFGKKIQGFLLYLLWWFIWIWVVSFTLFNLQFFHFGIGIGEYFWILLIIIILFIGKLIYKKENLSDYISTLKIKNPIEQIKQSFTSLSKTGKVFTIISAVFTTIFLLVSFIHVNKFPTYADDSFGNRNWPAYNIYQDGWVKLFGSEEEILARWRLGYPIYIPIYKALISDFLWWFNDIYINVWQRLVFFFLILFSIYFTRNKTKNIFYTILPAALICCLPLIYFHAVEWYMELACTAYSVVTIWLFYKFLEERDYTYISLGFLVGFILSHIKNDWLLWYFAWIIISFTIILLLKNNLIWFIKWFWKDKRNFYISIFSLVFFLLPFLVIRSINHLWLNPVTTVDWWVWLSKTIHREIFSVFPSIFTHMDNYNVILIILFLIFLFFLTYQKNNIKKYFLILPWIMIFIIFNLVFLLTENYLRVMNQTTVNRVFTMCFVIILSFIWILVYKEDE